MSRKLRRANVNLKKSGLTEEQFNNLFEYAYNNNKLKDLGSTYWKDYQAVGQGVNRVRKLIEDYNNDNNNDKIDLNNYSQIKDLTDAFRKFSGVYGDLQEWYKEQLSASTSTGATSQLSASTSTGATSQPSASTSTGATSTEELQKLNDLAAEDINNETERSLNEQYEKNNNIVNFNNAIADKKISDNLNKELNKNTLPEVKKITPGMDNLLALDRKGRRSLRRGEYTRLNNGTAVQAKTRREGRQLARAVNRQRRANNRADKRQGILDSYLAGYARKGGKLTLLDIYMNNK